MIIVVLMITGVSYSFAKGEIEKQIEEKDLPTDWRTAEEMEKQFSEHQRIGEALAEVVGEEGTELNTEAYAALQERLVTLNEATLFKV